MHDAGCRTAARIPGSKLLSETIGRRSKTRREIFPNLQLARLPELGIFRIKHRISVGPTLGKLGDHEAKGVELPRQHSIDGYDDIGARRRRLLKPIREKHKHRISFQGRYVGTEKWHGHHVSGVLDEHTCISVVGVIIVRAMRENEVRFPFSNQSGDGAAILKCRFELPIVNVQNDSLYSQKRMSRRHFISAPKRQSPARFAPMAYVSVRRGHQQYMVPLLCPTRCRSTDLNLAVIRMRPKGDDA